MVPVVAAGQTDSVVFIDPATGRVGRELDFSSLKGAIGEAGGVAGEVDKSRGRLVLHCLLPSPP